MLCGLLVLLGWLRVGILLEILVETVNQFHPFVVLLGLSEDLEITLNAIEITQLHIG